VVLTLCFKAFMPLHKVQCVVFFEHIRKNRCDYYEKRRPCVLSNISIVAILNGLLVAVNNSVPASQVGFQQFRAVERFCVEGSNKRSDRRHYTPAMIYNFLLTVLSERHIRIFAN